MDRWNTREERIVARAHDGGHGGSDSGVVAAFFRSIREDSPPPSTVADGVWALAAAVGAYRSAESGRWVAVAPIVREAGVSDA